MVVATVTSAIGLRAPVLKPRVWHFGLQHLEFLEERGKQTLMLPASLVSTMYLQSIVNCNSTYAILANEKQV